MGCERCQVVRKRHGFGMAKCARCRAQEDDIDGIIAGGTVAFLMLVFVIAVAVVAHHAHHVQL